ncbi:EAL domain-containing protein [Lachnobacterium bovis]|uniref:EAL domain-containing protein n=1 Tax=Lachnobacterium bovis TaxID=140626 RepID=UPI00048A1EB3|nr:EAL domain-containing protein [Lachnobacterium bovis]
MASKNKNKTTTETITNFLEAHDGRSEKYSERIPFTASVVVVLVIAVSMFIFCNIRVGNSNEYKTLGNLSSKKVLYLSSYDYSYVTVPEQLKGINSVFEKYQIRVDYEFMNTKKFPSDKTIENFYIDFKEKMKTVGKYDAVLAVDDPALNFVLEYREDFFENVPIVFFGINNKTTGLKAAHDDLITGTLEETYVRDTVGCALLIHPNRKRIVAISDNTSTGQGELREFYNASEEYKNKQFVDINISQCKKDEIKNKLNNLTKNDIVIFLNMQMDAEGNTYTLKEAMKFIAKNSNNAPVYSSSVIGVNTGIIGGKSTDFNLTSKDAAKRVVRLLKGKNIKNMAVEYDIGETFWFDDVQLRHFGIKYSSLPEKRKIYNYNKSYFEINKETIIAIEMFLGAVCIVFILITIDNRRKNGLILQLECAYEDLIKKDEQISYMVDHDELTKLYNRRAMENDMNRIIEEKHNFTIIHLDLDDFKFINDTYGHACGDKVLSEIGSRFKSVGFKYNFRTYRIGGDEFLIIIKDKFVQQNTIIMDEILNVKNEKIHFKNKDIYVSFSMGMAYHNGEKESVTNVIIKADLAMYEAKNYGKNNLVIYSENLKVNETRKQLIKQTVKEACKKNEIYIDYQPQFSLKEKTINAFEALVRLNSNLYRPSEFIPIIEESDIIISLGRRVLEKVIEEISTCIKEGIEMFPVSIKFSIKQLNDDTFFEYLESLLRKYNVPTSLIVIEITENLLIKNSKLTKKFFDKVTELKISVVLDEFGVGYASINYLSILPIKRIKIDKSILNEQSTEKVSFLKNIIKLIHSLNLYVIVEGIETPEEYEKVIEFNCDYAQGYYLARPANIKKIIELLEKNSKNN